MGLNTPPKHWYLPDCKASHPKGQSKYTICYEKMFIQNMRQQHLLYLQSTKAIIFKYKLYSSRTTTTAKQNTMNFIVFVGFDVLTVVTMRNTVSWECDDMYNKVHTRFWWMYGLHLQGHCKSGKACHLPGLLFNLQDGSSTCIQSTGELHSRMTSRPRRRYDRASTYDFTICDPIRWTTHQNYTPPFFRLMTWNSKFQTYTILSCLGDSNRK
jgi:hypothetical protein